MIERIVYFSVLVFLVSLSFSTALMEISFGVMLVGWLLLKAQGKNSFSFPCERKMFLWLLAFVILSSISFFWSEFPQQSFRGVLKVLQQFLLFWIASETLIPEDRRKTALESLVFLFLFLAADGAWQYVTGKDLLRQLPMEVPSTGARISASFHNYGLLTAFIVSFWPLLLCQLEERAKKITLFLTVPAIALGVLLLFWTRSRGGGIAFLTGLAFLLWLRGRKFLLGSLVLVAFVALFFLPREMLVHLDRHKKEQSLVERVYLWDRAFQVIRARPWTGTGINTYRAAHEKYDQRRNWRVRGYYAHNGYLQIAAETGLPSLACFLAFLLLYFKNAFRFLAHGPPGRGKDLLIAILAGMVGFLLLGTNDTVFHNPQSILGFWLLAGWGAAVTSAQPIRAAAKA